MLRGLDVEGWGVSLFFCPAVVSLLEGREKKDIRLLKIGIARIHGSHKVGCS